MSEGLFGKKEEVKAQEVVETFLGFFENHNHARIEGASIVPKNDPTLLFINSGMAPMKDYFLGIKTPSNPRMTNVQGCIRTKDIEEVGDRHHLTFFEMMGSWSIGDYWKEDAIRFAFELLTQGFGFPVDRLWASYYSGNEEAGIPADLESKAFWEKAGMHPDHIVPFGQDNFWGPAGKYGPCGPCTEVYFDTGSEFGPDFEPGGDFDVSDRYIEIWNAGVFMEYDLQPTGFNELKIKSVDTGSGLERMVMTLNGMNSCYDVDNMRPIREAALALIGDSASEGLAEMLTDHLRASVYIMAEGVFPGNTGRGYIARRLIRRCLAALAQLNEADNFSLKTLVDAVFVQSSSWNPLPEGSQESVWKRVEEEQEAFKKVLRRGLQKLESAIPNSANPELSGEEAFNLVATYGLPIDTIRDFVESKGGSVDIEAFETAFEAHRDISRQGSGQSAIVDYLTDTKVSVFKGLETNSGEGEIQVLMQADQLVEKTSNIGDEFTTFVVCDSTVFYPQGGGQVGDVGTLINDHGEMKVLDTQKTGTGHIVHSGYMISGEFAKASLVNMKVNEEQRKKNAVHHSATHLLNAALVKVLGDHVGQKGSLVEPTRLRFDFTHGKSITNEEQKRIQKMVNEFIKSGSERKAEVISYEDAIASGATAMFSDKYGDEVRVVSFGDFSKELCGGTHIKNTEEIELFLISSEGSSSRGVRRMVGVAGDAAYAQLKAHLDLVKQVDTRINEDENETYSGKFQNVVSQIRASLKSVNFDQFEDALAHRSALDIVEPLSESLDTISALLGTSPDKIITALNAKIKKALKANTKNTSSSLDVEMLKSTAKALSDGTLYVVGTVDADVPTMRNKAMEIAEQIHGIVCLMTADDRPKIVIGVDVPLAKKVSAKKVMDLVGPLIGGRGGGKPHLVAGGGTDSSGVPVIEARFEELINALV